MDEDAQERSYITEQQRPAIRFLVESALRDVVKSHDATRPRSREGWISHLCDTLMSESDTSHRSVISALIASGIPSEEIYNSIVPAAARYLGELWVADKASFVDVTVAAGRLQSLFRINEDDGRGAWPDRSIPLGQSVMMVLPPFENHSLGAFIAADHLRRHGLWVHMAIGLDNHELTKSLRTNRFSMVGISVATWNSVEHAAEVVEYLRAHVRELPPIVIGGRAAGDQQKVIDRTGADFAVRSAREAIEKCGLTTVATSLVLGEGV